MWRATSIVLAVALASCSPSTPEAKPAAEARTFGDRIIAADAEPQNWLSHGRDYQETRYSPLDQINTGNVAQLALAWSYDLDTNRGQEATPLVVDGKMYTSSAWSKVQAFDAVSGKLLWQYDPEVPGESAVKACCDVVNRGVAYWDGKVYVGTIDGRLIAINAATGKQLWSTMTVDPATNATITGAPRVVKGKVIIGFGGAEQGVRGFFSAYDADTGKQVWRFYTVPGEPGKKDGAASDAALEKFANKTWAGRWWTKEGGYGGGTVWDSMSYDPELDLLYIGVGNGAYWSREIRSAGQGDNLFISSILAVRPDTGEYVWHYQQVPGDEWDYTATQQMTLADLEVGGKMRKVLMQAPKNGFFYILDRATGELLSAEPITKQTWTTGIDKKTGRPNIPQEARWSSTGKPFLLLPTGAGAHNWHSQAYSLKTGLMYIPVQDFPNMMVPDPKFKPLPKGFNTGTDPSTLRLPDDPKQISAIRKSLKGVLLAWNPKTQKEAWRITHDAMPNGGVVATAGNLVFQGDGNGMFNAYDATNGKKLWSYDLGAVALAAPVSWSAGGVQYVTIVAGWGGSLAMSMGELFNDKDGRKRPPTGRVLTFRLSGKGQLPAPAAITDARPEPVAQFGTAAQIAMGDVAYHRTCFVCHGVNAYSGTAIPDLRYSGALGDKGVWSSIVSDGILAERGMVSFKDNFSPAEIEAIRAYVIHEANRAAKRR